MYIPCIALDRTSSFPIHRQIWLAIAQAIRDGDVFHDARLPSSRVMAKLLGVSRNTILRAYDDLAADGLVEAKRGSGLRVCQNPVMRAAALFGLRQVIRESGFPARVLHCEDQDGNPLYLRY